jgi:hypothetical protein
MWCISSDSVGTYAIRRTFGGSSSFHAWGAGREKALGVPSAARLAPVLEGWAQEGTQRVFGGLSGSHAWGWVQETTRRITVQKQKSSSRNKIYFEQ